MFSFKGNHHHMRHIDERSFIWSASGVQQSLAEYRSLCFIKQFLNLFFLISFLYTNPFRKDKERWYRPVSTWSIIAEKCVAGLLALCCGVSSPVDLLLFLFILSFWVCCDMEMDGSSFFLKPTSHWTGKLKHFFLVQFTNSVECRYESIEGFEQ